MEYGIDTFKDLLKQISIKELNSRINNYRILINERDNSEDYIRESVRKIFSVDGVSFFIRSDVLTNIYQMFYFYRVRKFARDEEKRLYDRNFMSMKGEADAWSRPFNQINDYGRLNRPKQSVLYVSAQPFNALYETKCQEGDYFFLIVYHNKKQMRISQIHDIQYMEEFSEIENAKRILMHNFLLHEFTKDVPANKNYLYKSSLIIYEEFFYRDQLDAFAYPSVASAIKMGYNCSFNNESSKNNLNLVGVMVCRLAPKDSKSEFNFEVMYDGILNDKNEFEFHNYDSKISREKFGDFAFMRDVGML